MLKFLATNPETGRRMLGLVLMEENVERLKEDKPIHFHAEQIKLTELKVNEIVILYFPTMEEAIKFFKDQGLTKANIFYEERQRH